jgi:hypothetical protein
MPSEVQVYARSAKGGFGPATNAWLNLLRCQYDAQSNSRLS